MFDDGALGHLTKMRWNDTDQWITSAEPTHEPLVSQELFDAAQAMFDRNKRATTRTPRSGRHYVLAGRMHCSVCGRRMQGQWNHGRAYYRCKFTEEYPDGDQHHPRNIYVKEDAILPGLDRWLATLFDAEHIDDTVERLAGVSEPDPAAEERVAALRSAIADCDRKLANYRACSTTRTPSPSPRRGSPTPNASARRSNASSTGGSPATSSAANRSEHW